MLNVYFPLFTVAFPLPGQARHLQQAACQGLDIQVPLRFGGDDLVEFGGLQLDGNAIQS